MKHTTPTKPAAKHTPGPWHAAGQIYRLDREGREFIGIGNGAEHVGYASITCCVRLAEAKANARLIAAAPELLEALQDLLDCPDLNLDSLEPTTMEAIKRARSAINTATGQS